MKNNFAAFGIGILFALGLGISGMTKPEKVIGFLDVFDNWDPSLIFVMIGAIGVHFFTYKIIRRKPSPLFSDVWHVPTKKQITPALIIGSSLFGIGWGLAGYCPGPAVVSMATLQTAPWIFMASLLVGMLIFNILDRRLKFNR